MRARIHPLFAIFLVVLVGLIGMTMMMPILPYYAEHFGAKPMMVNALQSSFAICQLISGPIIGALSDRVGRKRLLIVSQVGTVISFLMMAFANSLWVLFAARILDGITAGNLSLAQAYISDISAPKDRAKSFAVIGIAFGLGFIIGPAISSVLAAKNIAYPFFAAAVLAALSVVATITLLSEPKRSKEQRDAANAKEFGLKNFTKFFREPVLASLLWQFFLYCFVFSLFMSSLAMILERALGFRAKHVGYLMTYFGVLGAILQAVVFPRLVRRWGESRVVTISYISQLVSYAILVLVFTVRSVVVAATFGSIGNGFQRPALTSLISRQVSATEQGAVLGVTQSINSIAMIFAPAVSGFFVEHGWFSSLYVVAIALVAYSFFVSIGGSLRVKFEDA